VNGWIDKAVCYRLQTTQAANNYRLQRRRRVWARVTPESTRAGELARIACLLIAKVWRRRDHGSVFVTKDTAAASSSRIFARDVISIR